MEEYFPADRLLELTIGTIVHINPQGDEKSHKTQLVGCDNGHSVITTLPIKGNENRPWKEIFPAGLALELKTIHNGKVIAFESTITGLYNNRLLIGSFPEMIETRRLRRDVRFPCTLSCDIHTASTESFGVISNISIGGCQLNVSKDEEHKFIEDALNSQSPIDLEIFFPFYENSVVISALVKSSSCQIDGACKVGMSFEVDYECVRRYLESLQLDSVAPFFS